MPNDPASLGLIALAAAAALAYGFHFLDRPRTWVRALVKTAAVGALAAAFWLLRPGPLVYALALSALGDFALAWDKKWTLPLGILAFMLAQLLYLAMFFGLWLAAGEIGPLWPRYLAMGAIGLFVLAYLAWLWPKLGLMAFGVVPYALAIGAMGMMSFWLDWRAWPAMLGATLFLVSDGVLAAELFRLAPDSPARRITGPVVWWTYVAAQALIAAGIVIAVRTLAG